MQIYTKGCIACHLFRVPRSGIVTWSIDNCYFNLGVIDALHLAVSAVHIVHVNIVNYHRYGFRRQRHSSLSGVNGRVKFDLCIFCRPHYEIGEEPYGRTFVSTDRVTSQFEIT